MSLPTFLRASSSPSLSATGAPGSRRSSPTPLDTTTVLLSDFDDPTSPRFSELDMEDDESHRLPPPRSPHPHRGSRRPKTLLQRLSHYKRYIILIVVLYFLYHLLRYLYSDPERWLVPVEESVEGPLARPVETIVRASGRLYRGMVYEPEGTNAGVGYVGWKGIKYADAPIGERRFRNSRLIEVKTVTENEDEHVIDAIEWDQGCARIKNGMGGTEGYDGSEDCLRLNVFSPTKRIPGHLLPVLFWIHGGGFVAGYAADPRYEPRELMERAHSMDQPIIIVSMNYRLAGLGFSASPPKPGAPPTPPHIPTQRPDELDLNVGLKDQLVALYWVQREIENFGGDPKAVTIVGHSAGAMSVGLHQLYSPPGLFRAAFMMSGGPTSFPVPWPHDAGARTLHPLAGPAQCPAPEAQQIGPPSNARLLECLRTLSTERFMESTRTLSDPYAINGWFPWYPVLEGEFEGSWINVRPSERIVRGTYNKVPIVMGSVTDEGTRFASPGLDSQQAVQAALQKAFSFAFGAIEDLLEPIWDFYPSDAPSLGSPYGTGNETFGLDAAYKQGASLLGDVFFQAPRRHLLRETPKDFGEAAWSYVWDEPREGAEPRLGVQHGADMTSWWGHPESTDSEIHHLSRHMTSYLINFVNHMNPNGPGLRHWPQYGMDQRQLQFARHNITTTLDEDRSDAIRFLNINNPIFQR